MGGRFTSHDIASCEGGREGRRGDRKTEKEREREREREKGGCSCEQQLAGCAASQSRLHLSSDIHTTLEGEVRIFVLNVVVASKKKKEN